ncbi:MAG: DCC1-like thiol-disulfide oxidoreductase family protein [Pseudomonadota bacterium]
MSLPPTYIFDGECVLCSRAVHYVLAHDRSDPSIRFVAIKSAEGRLLAKQHGVDPDNPHTFIYIEDGVGYLSSNATFAMLKRTGGPGRWVRIFRFVPRPLRDWVYARVANNRFNWFGKLDHCYMPTPETRDRFVLE